MSIALFVEGKSDKDTIPKLICKLFDTLPKIIPRTIHRGEMFKAEKVRPYLEALLKQHEDVEKFIVCVDSECTDPEEIREEVSKAERELNEVGLPVRYALIVHALEGWLAADAKALGQVLGRQVRVGGKPGRSVQASGIAEGHLRTAWEKLPEDQTRSANRPPC
jgi:hypothetical protein